MNIPVIHSSTPTPAPTPFTPNPTPSYTTHQEGPRPHQGVGRRRAEADERKFLLLFRTARKVVHKKCSKKIRKRPKNALIVLKISKNFFLLTYFLFLFVLRAETYSLSFQRNGEMNKASTDIYAVYKGSLPSMEVFSICAWVKFHFEVSFILNKIQVCQPQV